MFIDIEIHVGFLVVLSRRKYVSIVPLSSSSGSTWPSCRPASCSPCSRYSLSLHPKHQSSHLRIPPILVLGIAKIDLIQSRINLPLRPRFPSDLSPEVRPRLRAVPKLPPSILHHDVLARRHAAEMASDQQRAGHWTQELHDRLGSFNLQRPWKQVEEGSGPRDVYLAFHALQQSVVVALRISVATGVLRSVSRSPNRSST